MYIKRSVLLFCEFFTPKAKCNRKQENMCSLAHTITYSLQKEIDNSRREK